MHEMIQLLVSFTGSLGFAVLFNIHGKKLWFAALGGCLSWAVYLIVGIWTSSPLIPGAALYRTMNWMMMQEWDKFCADGTYTILFAASMAAGMTLTTILFRMVWSWKYRQRWM